MQSKQNVLRNILVIYSALFSLSAMAGAMPEKLVCFGTEFLAGNPRFNDTRSYFPREISPGMLTAEKGPDIDMKKGVTTITYAGGDQYRIYKFKESDLSAIASSAVDSIEGTFEDGYDWVNGYNVRARFAIRCHL